MQTVLMSDQSAEQRDPWQPLRLVGGWVLLISGLALFPMPFPAGFAMIAGGAALLAHDSRTFRCFFNSLKRRYPRFFSSLHKKSAYLPGPLARRFRHLLESDDN
jgi:hypothetical protein